MILYDVYLASFQTLAGTFRSYIGYTGNADKREDKLGQLGPTSWGLLQDCLGQPPDFTST